MKKVEKFTFFIYFSKRNSGKTKFTNYCSVEFFKDEHFVFDCHGL